MTSTVNFNESRLLAKEELLEAIAHTDRGRTVTPNQQQQILTLLERLEQHNPTTAPTASPLLSGNWLTVYTTSQDLLRLSNPLLGIASGEIYQSIRAEEGRVFNVAEVKSAIAGLNTIPGGIVAIAAHFSVASDSRVNVVFDQFVVGFQWMMNYRIDTFLTLLAQCPEQIPAVKLPVNAAEKRAG